MHCWTYTDNKILETVSKGFDVIIHGCEQKCFVHIQQLQTTSMVSTFSIVIQSKQHHKFSNIHLVITYTTFGRQLQPLLDDSTTIRKATWGTGSSSIYLHIVAVPPDDSSNVGQNKSCIRWIIWMLAYLLWCTDWITPENTDWTNTTVWHYLKLQSNTDL